MALTCSNCGKELPDDAKFCGDCGTTVVVQEKKPDCCANCFAELPEGVKFCLQCGKPAVIAQYPISHPERDKAIYEELGTTYPQYLRVLEWQDVYKRTGKYPLEYYTVEDFEQNKATIAARARKWAEYETKGMERIHWFQECDLHFVLLGKIQSVFRSEEDWFRTNKPNSHKALFCEEVYKYYLYKFREQGALTWNDPPQPTPLFLTYLKKVVGFSDENIKDYTVELPDIEEIRRWAAIDDELFPPPQPLRVEVAGAMLNFTTNEGVLVVYVDCAHKGKTLAIKDISELSYSDYPDKTADIRERTVDNTVVCAAIFNHIPFVSNSLLYHHKHREKALTQMECTVETNTYRDFPNRWQETVMVYRGKVVDLDWRGRK
jgi:Double zinc ribbon